MKKIKIFDIVLAVIIFIILIYFSFNKFFFKSDKAKFVTIETAKDKYIYYLPLEKTITIKGETGITIIEIKGEKFRFIESACKNKYCVKNGWISLPYYPVVCLPNRISAYIELQGEKNIDAVSR